MEVASLAEAAAEAAAEAGNIKFNMTYTILGGNMSKKEEFKIFVKQHPELIKFIKNKEMTWQSFFEIYSIYGANNDIWNKYFNNDESSSNSNMSVSDLIEMVKKVDLDTVQKNINNISKALGLVQSLITKDEVPVDTYTPRPLYKKFED